ncbi:MAG: hypothetical protein LBK00_01085 [Treponema sp.]|jgi:ABC-type sugar transport system substrate-binding protein|nr:hypothetical protein [Treponema sp.]
MKRKLFCVVVGVFVAVAAVWGNGQRQSAWGAMKTYTLGFSPYDLNQESYRVIHNAIKVAVEAKGDAFVSADAVGDTGILVLNYAAAVKDQVLAVSEEHI